MFCTRPPQGWLSPAVHCNDIYCILYVETCCDCMLCLSVSAAAGRQSRYGLRAVCGLAAMAFFAQCRIRSRIMHAMRKVKRLGDATGAIGGRHCEFVDNQTSSDFSFHAASFSHDLPSQTATKHPCMPPCRPDRRRQGVPRQSLTISIAATAGMPSLNVVLSMIYPASRYAPIGGPLAGDLLQEI